MLLGYPPGNKGYKLLDLTTNQTFVSRDTIFHENTFPMNPVIAKPYNHPTAVIMPYTHTNHLLSVDDVVVLYIHEPTSPPSSFAPLSNAFDIASTIPPTPLSLPLRRSTRVLKQPVWLDSYLHTLHKNANTNMACWFLKILNPNFTIFWPH